MFGQSLRQLFALLVVALFASACSSSGSRAAEIQVVDAPDVATSTTVPTTAPVSLPTTTAVPTATTVPTPFPTGVPTALPTAAPTAVPTAVPAPTEVPAPEPAAQPAPTEVATSLPTAVPAPEPAAQPAPTAAPTALPTAVPAPTEAPGAGGPPAEHVVSNVGFVPLGQAGGVSIVLPAAQIELIGFHEAGHPGSQAFNAANTGVPTMVLASRGRNTDARSAADIVLPPNEPVRAPATGTVVAANSYILYCEHQDRLVYIEPDGLPGWQVRVFHVNGPLPAVGDRVVAGETVIGTGANLFPFESQVDEFTAEPSWAHVHIEVVDTNVPDTRPPGPGCP